MVKAGSKKKNEVFNIVEVCDVPKDQSDVPLLFMLPGVPDDHSAFCKLADEMKDTHRVVIACLPLYDQNAVKKGQEVYYSVEEVLFMLENTVFGVMEKYSVSKVSMVVHDMGCVFGYHFAFLHPSKVDSFISFDIGATVKCTKKDLEAERTKAAFDKSALYQFKSFKGGKGRLNMAKMMFYQWSFCLFYLLGTKVSYDISNLLLQNFVRVLNWTSFIQKREHKHTSGRSASDIRCFILYPYLAVWSKVFGKDKSLMRNYTYVSKHMDAAGSDGKRPETYSGNLPVFLPLSDEVKCLFMYGSEKTLTFHTESFLQELKSRPGCASMGVEGGHWFYWDKPDLVAKVVRDFLSGIVYNYADSPRLKPSRL